MMRKKEAKKVQTKLKEDFYNLNDNHTISIDYIENNAIQFIDIDAYKTAWFHFYDKL